jgi:demethylmenaquinone methyltransferase/2-methoxy-6-polyprenyl-1,4-benzoquinol methylase
MDDLSPRHHRMRAMFDAVAPRYDLLNRLLSLGIDRRWRKRAVGQLPLEEGGLMLDAASGTCDVALEIIRQAPGALRVVAADLSEEMLRQGRIKLLSGSPAGRISLVGAACESLPLSDRRFNGAIIAFGIRNVADRPAALKELFRVLRPGGKLVVLEFSEPPNPAFRLVYHVYFHRLLPLVGALFSQPDAYRYLPASVQEFPPRREFEAELRAAGFVRITHRDLSFGIVTLYCASRS